MLLISIIDRVMPPLHLFAYSTLLGTEIYQSFVMTKLAYRSLPQSAFRSLQKSVFPVYFQGQTLLLALVVCTLPPQGLQSLVGNRTHMVTFALAGGTALLNLLIFGPKTQRLMIERVHQATQHIKHNTNAEVVASEKKELDRAFSRAHAMSIHLNLITIIATLCYGWHLSARMK